MEISERTLQAGPRGGIFVQVPEASVIETARDPWETTAEKFASTAAEDYDDNLDRLAPSTVGIIRGIARHRPMVTPRCYARTSREDAARRNSPRGRCSPACRPG